MKKLIVLLMILAMAGFASAVTWSSIAAKDTMADLQWPNDNLGGWTGLQVGSGWPPGTDRFNSWLGFDLPSDLAGKTITSATLTMKQAVGGAGGSFPTLGIKVNLMTHDWTEMGLTVYKYDGLNGWTGGNSMGYADRVAVEGVPVIYDTQNVILANYSDVVFNMTSAVQYWANGGANFGLVLDAVNTGSYDTYLQFCSSEVAGSEPVLSITYEIPEPITLTLFSIGGLVAIRRKK